MAEFYTLDNIGPECFSGWNSLIQPVLDYVNEYNKDIPDGDDENLIHILQVKEKFGTLDIIVSRSDDELDRLIKDAAWKSSNTCEICGEEGKLRSIGGWYQTRCDKHKRA